MPSGQRRRQQRQSHQYQQQSEPQHQQQQQQQHHQQPQQQWPQWPQWEPWAWQQWPQWQQQPPPQQQQQQQWQQQQQHQQQQQQQQQQPSQQQQPRQGQRQQHDQGRKYPHKSKYPPSPLPHFIIQPVPFGASWVPARSVVMPNLGLSPRLPQHRGVPAFLLVQRFIDAQNISFEDTLFGSKQQAAGASFLNLGTAKASTHLGRYGEDLGNESDKLFMWATISDDINGLAAEQPGHDYPTPILRILLNARSNSGMVRVVSAMYQPVPPHNIHLRPGDAFVSPWLEEQALDQGQYAIFWVSANKDDQVIRYLEGETEPLYPCVCKGMEQAERRKVEDARVGDEQDRLRVKAEPEEEIQNQLQEATKGAAEAKMERSRSVKEGTENGGRKGEGAKVKVKVEVEAEVKVKEELGEEWDGQGKAADSSNGQECAKGAAPKEEKVASTAAQVVKISNSGSAKRISRTRSDENEDEDEVYSGETTRKTSSSQKGSVCDATAASSRPTTRSTSAKKARTT